MKIFLDYEPPNWNDYINLERTNKYGANNLKQKEKIIVKMQCYGKRYEGEYPAQLIIKPHFSAMRQDLDNFRYKGILDGLVSAGVIKNDNLKHIQRIIIDPVFDKLKGVEIEIKEMEK